MEQKRLRNTASFGTTIWPESVFAAMLAKRHKKDNFHFILRF